MSQAKLCCCGLSSGFSSFRSCTLYAQRYNRFWKTLCTIAYDICSSCEAQWIDFVGVQMNIVRTFSTFSSETRRPPLCLSRHSESPETCCAMIWSPLRLVLLSDKLTKLSLHPQNGLKPRKPHNSSRLLLSWHHLCVKWWQRPNSGPWGSLRI
jgi:hypothetical protein